MRHIAANTVIILLSMGSLLAACSGASHAVHGPDEAIGADAEHTHHLNRLLSRAPLELQPIPPGFVLPYAVERVYGTFGDCRSGGRRQHSGIDLGGIGENAGLGTPVRAMARARVTMIGRPDEDPGRFGRPDTRSGNVERNGELLPRVLPVSAYGNVAFFTRDYGSWHSGAIIVTEVIGTELDGYQIRYMHLGAVHPELREGDVIEAGQELGLMGGTAIMHDHPHVHIDIEDEDGERIDPAPYVGLAPDTHRCR